MSNDVYLGNPLLKKANTPIEFTKEQVEEYIKCREDPVYFAQNYVQIVTLDHGLQPFKTYDFQEKLIKNFHENRFNICKMPRQTGKSTTCVSYLLHYAIFNDSVNIGILANKATTARELLARLATAYENLPKWMQQGILVWNKGNIELENGSKILAASTSASAVRGMSFNILFLDEFAFVPNHVADSFFASVYPTITSGKNTKVIIVSTPHGMNHFYRMWHDAEKSKNEYIPTDVHWSEVPGRDQAWKEKPIRNTSEEQFSQEFECEFLGSVDTLISPAKIKNTVYIDPLQSKGGLRMFKKPDKDKLYVACVDVARGTGKDYSAFIILDVTKNKDGKILYEVVATYKNNEVKPFVFPNIVAQTCKAYNEAHVLVEVNDLGQAISEAMHYELEYPNILMTTQKGRAGQILGAMFSGRGTSLGIRMTKQIKKVGCANFKTLMEGDRLIINDFNIIEEMSTFSRRGNSWQAEEGCNDDLVMCLVMFGWLSNQPYFKELSDSNIRSQMYMEQEKLIEQDMAPFGFVDDGINSDPENEETIDEYGTRWFPVSRKGQ